MFTSALYLLLAAFSVACFPVAEPGFDHEIVEKVEADMLQIATHRYEAFVCMHPHHPNICHNSWELGTACETLTELLAPSLSVFRATAFPPPHKLSTFITGNTTIMINIATQYVIFTSFSALLLTTVISIVETKQPGTLPLTDGDGAVGDPASKHYCGTITMSN